MKAELDALVMVVLAVAVGDALYAAWRRPVRVGPPRWLVGTAVVWLAASLLLALFSEPLVRALRAQLPASALRDPVADLRFHSWTSALMAAVILNTVVRVPRREESKWLRDAGVRPPLRYYRLFYRSVALGMLAVVVCWIVGGVVPSLIARRSLAIAGRDFTYMWLSIFVVLGLIQIVTVRQVNALNRLRRLRAEGRPICVECGYDLRGSSAGRCPECGAECDHPVIDDRHHVQPQPPSTDVRQAATLRFIPRFAGWLGRLWGRLAGVARRRR